MSKAVEAAHVRPLAFTDSPHNMIAMPMLTAALELSFLFDFSLIIADVASLITARKGLDSDCSSSERITPNSSKSFLV